MYILDNNFIIDILADRNSYKKKYLDILLYCLDKSIACICVNQIDTLRYVIKKDFRYLKELKLK